MNLRDLFVTAVVFITLPFVLKRPHIGIMLWAWLSYMNPHRLTWGFAYEMPFAQLTALVILAGILINMNKEPRKIPWTRETILIAVFLGWMFVTTMDAVLPDAAWLQMIKVYKIQLMTFITLMLINTPQRINMLIWVIVLSLGFYGVKGGIFTITTGGGYHVRGPNGTFIGGNNEIGLALIMTFPLLCYLQLQAKERWLRWGLGASMFFTLVAILGTQSRGALVGLLVMGSYFFLKSRKKLIISIVGVMVIPVALSFMPQTWYDRMDTIKTYEEDVSAKGRLWAWEFAFNNTLKNPLTGGGFEVFRTYGTDAHSIYFEIMGEHGFVGLTLFLLIGYFTLRTGQWIKKRSRGQPDLLWANDLATMLQVSLVGYATSGAFLGLAYFDLYWHLVALMVLTRVYVTQAASEQTKGHLKNAAAVNRNIKFKPITK